jgi:hypothetical protein
MGELFQEILNTLTVFPGSLVYHLVLGFTIAGAFQAAMNLWRESSFPQGRRMVIGLGLLLSVQLILFVGAGLTGKDVFDPHGLSPILDRTSTALGIIIIIWLWAFPEPQRSADAASGLLVLLTFTAAALSFVWWSENSAATFFNGTWLDTGWELYSLGLLGIGILTLLIRKPNSWGVGISMMTVLSVGHIFHLVAPLPGNDFAGVVRLAQMAGYPLLLALPHRFQAPTIVEPQAPKKLQPLFKERPQYSVSPQVFRSILAIGAQKSFPEICETMTRTIAEAMLADVCLALLPPNRDGQMNVQCGFDLIREKNIPGQLFDGKDIPLLLSVYLRAAPRAIFLPWGQNCN